jgi:pimeloyl-ACP methyl ester carboxylesterase
MVEGSEDMAAHGEMAMPRAAFGLKEIFQHRVVDAHGSTVHVVEGGTGSVLVLISGWPQTWIAWRKLMPQLAEAHHVLAVDLPGLGASEEPSRGYGVASVAMHVKAALDALNVTECQLVGHDIGAWISYAVAAQHPEVVKRLVLIDAAIPGLTSRDAFAQSPATMQTTWHFAFNYLPSLSEILVIGREREFLTWLFKNKSMDWEHTFDAPAVNEYVRSYSAPGRWSSGLGYYRAIFQSAEENRILSERRLRMPVLAIGGGNGLGYLMKDEIQRVTDDLRVAMIKNCGHYVPEEQPEKLLDTLQSFLI